MAQHPPWLPHCGPGTWKATTSWCLHASPWKSQVPPVTKEPVSPAQPRQPEGTMSQPPAPLVDLSVMPPQLKNRPATPSTSQDTRGTRGLRPPVGEAQRHPTSGYLVAEECDPFAPIKAYKDNAGVLKHRRLMKSDRMWFHPPEAPGYIGGALPNPAVFFRGRMFVWHPVGVWRCSLKCPQGDQCAGVGKAVYLYKSGYHHRVWHICDTSSRHTLITEVPCCGPCTNTARNKEGVSVDHWIAWDF
ncbi:uncharacterized protein LOC129191426 [Dunckerocampus dactyliophorus]|uniref:uncharacterized protein LOC129191426 n=1 Tax=Dunckerocampus dactyliophorus TaxID=161453 RepID=UPI002405BF90|nr:uncharacterized protein LOC129191426 [Dunckerocampus dactyliophorus]